MTPDRETLNAAERRAARRRAESRWSDPDCTPPPQPNTSAVNARLVLTILAVLTVVFGLSMLSFCESRADARGTTSTGAAVDEAVAPFSTPAGPLDDAHSAGLPDHFAQARKKVVDPFVPSGRWARLRERCRWEVA